MMCSYFTGFGGHRGLRSLNWEDLSGGNEGEYHEEEEYYRERQCRMHAGIWKALSRDMNLVF